nr:VOC family protein [Jannaschia sp. Os4]
MSLNVRDLAASRAFYEALGFEVAGDHAEEGWMILRDGATTLGLFGGFIEANCLTFNPGWTQDAAPVAGGFEDVRAIQARMRAAGYEPQAACDPDGAGPASFTIRDPDGNVVLVD